MSELIKSWVESANDPSGEFPLNNLPYGLFSIGSGERRCCVAIGDQVLDLKALEEASLLDASGALQDPTLISLMQQGPKVWASIRERLFSLLRSDGDDGLQLNDKLRSLAFHTILDVTLHLPFKVSEYTDFFSGRHHAQNAGTMFRGPELALPPNWLHMPIAYNGRASTVVVSGTDIVRPCGQLKSPEYESPVFAASRRLDIELEMGAVIGGASAIGTRLSVGDADALIFGYVMLNDWSARDIQAWEYQPLGPFQAKAFATSISPWIVTKAALEPFRASTPEREKPLLDYLKEPGPMLYDIDLEVGLRPTGSAETIICRTNYNEMYYSSAQQLAHHTSSGCAMNVGDLLGSGTISGPTKSSRGSLLELSWGGKEPLELDDGTVRTFIEDGDKLTFRGHAQGDGYRIGFGECVGTIMHADV